jgi:hypothetical protein
MRLVQQSVIKQFPETVRRHRDTNHSEYKGKDISFFKRRLGTLKTVEALWWKVKKLRMKALPRPPTE